MNFVRLELYRDTQGRKGGASAPPAEAPLRRGLQPLKPHCEPADDYPRDTMHSWADDMGELLDSEHLFVLKAYFDESRRDPNGTILALAGYFGRTTAWRRLCREWNNVLAWYGIKRGLHMKEFAHFKGEFKIFEGNEPRRREFLAKLINTLYKNPPRFVAVGCAVDVRAFAELPAEKTVTFKHDPYMFAFFLCLRGAIESDYIQHLPTSETMGFVFDRRDDFQHQALDLFGTAKSMPTIPHRERLGDVAFADRHDSPPLQAADFIAYEVRKDLETRLVSAPERWGIGRIKSGPSSGIYVFDRPNLRKWFKVDDGS
jgi:hypothetical protein